MSDDRRSPREIKRQEKRVAITSGGVTAFVSHGKRIMIEKGAEMGSAITDEQFQAAGAEIIVGSKLIWQESDMILKVKEPLPEEYAFLREGQVIFTCLHLAANKELTDKMKGSMCIGNAYETIQLDDGSLTLLTPMSEVAGRLAIQVGARWLEVTQGGRGVLLSGVSGVPPAKVVIIGAGIVGSNACHVAVGMGPK